MGNGFKPQKKPLRPSPQSELFTFKTAEEPGLQGNGESAQDFLSHDQVVNTADAT